MHAPWFLIMTEQKGLPGHKVKENIHHDSIHQVSRFGNHAVLCGETDKSID